MVIDQLVSRNASGIRTIVDNQTSGSSSDYLQLPGPCSRFLVPGLCCYPVLKQSRVARTNSITVARDL